MPSITSSSPLPNAIEIPLGTSISVTFDTDMDPNSINTSTFVVYDQALNILTGAITYTSSTKTATFFPTDPLLVRNIYTVVIVGGTGVGVHTMPDGFGNVSYLASNYEFSFTTNDGRFFSPPLNPVPSGVNPNIVYPSGVDFFSAFIVDHTMPS